MSASPLDQFKILSVVKLPNVFGYNIDFTNSSLYMLISVILAASFFLFGIRKAAIVPGYWQTAVEFVYEFIASLLEGSSGREGLRHIPLVFTIFVFIATCNIAGMLPLPMSFTVTSHIIVTFALAMIVFFNVTITGFKQQGLGFLRIFLPKGTPLWLAPMMILIELSAYFTRPVSLAIRLAANMVAGHIVMKVIANLTTQMNILLIPLPLIFIMMLICFETFIAILQAYIFVALVSVYLSDAVNKH
ncbi:MAG: F0F1 ATP synthase subunit A [Wolbachia endosymbiont of Xenopsylla cheopis]|uniref:F0F1 ATP synthase subunit A n=1 Tax=Candidatus Mesenet endosymbiont of Phosphuga atrata TaxID=3066221 RepID=UPI0030D479E4